MSHKSYSGVLRLDYLASNRKQRRAIAFEMFILNTLVKVKGLVGGVSGDILIDPLVLRLGMIRKKESFVS